MKYSRKWLNHTLCPEYSFESLSENLERAGLKVQLLPQLPPQFSGVVVGEIKSIAPHPNADKLQLCKVNVGGEALLSIVCGAKNIYEGMRAPVAVVGAALPGNFIIKKSKLRGEESCGMLCSAKELGFAENAKGILPLPANAPIGADLIDYLNLNDELVDVTEIAQEIDEMDVLKLINFYKNIKQECKKPLKISKLKKLLKVVFRL